MEKVVISESLIGEVLNILNTLPRGKVNLIATKLEQEIIPQIKKEPKEGEQYKK